MTSLGERMKSNYEHRSRHELIRRMPVIVRVDGKAFHTYARGLARPFSQSLMGSMEAAALAVGREMQGFKAGYVQSDEASFLCTDYDTLSTEAWFGYVKSKIETISASCMTAEFNHQMSGHNSAGRVAHFDARAFNIPREEVANYFLWRSLDWERNSLSMYCQSVCSHKEMHGQGRAGQHELLHSRGMNWATDLSDRERNGAWIFKDGDSRYDVTPKYTEIAELLDGLVNCDKSPVDTFGLDEVVM